MGGRDRAGRDDAAEEEKAYERDTHQLTLFSLFLLRPLVSWSRITSILTLSFSFSLSLFFFYLSSNLTLPFSRTQSLIKRTQKYLPLSLFMFPRECLRVSVRIGTCMYWTPYFYIPIVKEIHIQVSLPHKCKRTANISENHQMLQLPRQ